MFIEHLVHVARMVYHNYEHISLVEIMNVSTVFWLSIILAQDCCLLMCSEKGMHLVDAYEVQGRGDTINVESKLMLWFGYFLIFGGVCDLRNNVP